MDFEPTDDQLALQEGVRAFLDGRFPIEAVRAIEDGGGRLDRGRWRELAETGVFSLTVPEADGGLGLGVSEAVLVFEELGRALVPGPLVGSFLAAKWLPEAGAGELVVGVLEPAEPVTVLEFPDDVDALLLLGEGGVHRVDPGQLTGEPVARPVDALTPLRVVTSPIPEGEHLAGPGVAHRARLEAVVLTAALQLGLARRTKTSGRSGSRDAAPLALDPDG